MGHVGNLSNRVGKFGEKIAVAYLWLKGFKILKRNYISYGREIDIIALKDSTLHFIEVKTTTTKIDLYERMNSRKIKRIIQGTTGFLKCEGVEGFSIDLLIVKFGRLGLSVEFLENVTF